MVAVTGWPCPLGEFLDAGGDLVGFLGDKAAWWASLAWDTNLVCPPDERAQVVAEAREAVVEAVTSPTDTGVDQVEVCRAWWMAELLEDEALAGRAREALQAALPVEDWPKVWTSPGDTDGGLWARAWVLAGHFRPPVGPARCGWPCRLEVFLDAGGDLVGFLGPDLAAGLLDACTDALVWDGRRRAVEALRLASEAAELTWSQLSRPELDQADLCALVWRAQVLEDPDLVDLVAAELCWREGSEQ